MTQPSALPDPGSPQPAGDGPQRFGTPVDFGRIFTALWRARLWLLAAFIVGAGAGVAYAKFVIPPVYRSQFVVRFDGFSELPGVPDVEETALVELEQAFTVPDVVGPVKKKLGLKPPTKVVRKLITTSSSSQTDTVAVATTAHEAKEAKEFADALYNEAVAYRERERQQTIRATLDRVQDRIDSQRDEVERMRKLFRDFRKENGIEDLSTEQRQGLAGAAELQAQRDLTQTEVKALEARVKQLQKDVRQTPAMEVATSAVSSPDHDRLASLEAELSQARSSLSEDHPRVRSLELQVNQLRRRISSGNATSVSHSTMTRSAARSAAATSLAAAQADLQATKQRLASLSTMAEDAQSKMKRFTEIEGKAVALMTQVQVAETLLGNLQAERAQLNDAMRRPETGFTKLNPATVPDNPEPNKKRRKIAASVPAALVALVILVAIGREFWGGRLMTPGELAFWGQGPVLAASTWPRDPTALDELVADFDDCAREPVGETLMVGATDSVLSHTGLLARRLHEEWFENAVVVQPQAPAQLPRTRALASGDAQESGAGTTIELWSRKPVDNETGGYAAGPGPVRSARGRVLAWSGGMEGHGLRRAARLADRVVVVVEAGRLNPLSLRRVRAAIARDDGVGFILVSAPVAVSQGRDRIGPVHEFWQGALA